MRRLFILPALWGLLLFCIAGCSRNNTGNELQGKLVMRGGCYDYVIQLRHGYLPPDRINASWEDPLTGIVYTNVFTVSNSCTFSNSGKFSIGDVIRFRVDNSVTETSNNCIVCVWSRPEPPARNAVVDARKKN